MTIAGIDPSVTSTGLAIWRDGLFINARVAPPKGSRDPGRMLWIAETIASRFETLEPLLLAIEEHAGQQGYASANVALHWIIRAEVAKRANSRCIVVAPSTLKKFVTGKGNAEKGTVGGRDRKGVAATSTGGAVAGGRTGCLRTVAVRACVRWAPWVLCRARGNRCEPEGAQGGGRREGSPAGYRDAVRAGGIGWTPR